MTDRCPHCKRFWNPKRAALHEQLKRETGASKWPGVVAFMVLIIGIIVAAMAVHG